MSLRELIFHNFWLKCFSIALGTVIWMAVHYSIEHDFAFNEPGPSQVLNKENITVPVTLFQQPGDNRTFNISPAEVQLTVIGEAATLRGPEMKDIKIFVDLTDFHSRTALQEDLHSDVPHGITVLDIKPSSVSVEPATP